MFGVSKIILVLILFACVSLIAVVIRRTADKEPILPNAICKATYDFKSASCLPFCLEEGMSHPVQANCSDSGCYTSKGYFQVTGCTGW